MTSGQHVVIVDGVPETADVLREVFEPLGHRVERVRSFDPIPRDALSGQSVLVLHDEASSSDDPYGKYGELPRVIVGSITTDTTSIGDEQRLVQPFHYADLIRAVEAALGERFPGRAAA